LSSSGKSRSSLRFPDARFLLLIFLVLSVSLHCYAMAAKNTNALFSDNEMGAGNVFAARTCGPTVTDDIFEILPGTSRAQYVARPGPFPTIARFDSDGRIYLDFGEIQAGNCRNAPDVFRVKNISGHAIATRLELSSTLVPLFSKIGIKGGNKICPSQQKRVEMKLSTSFGRRPGAYFGTLTVSDSSKRQYRVIPIQVIVILDHFKS